MPTDKLPAMPWYSGDWFKDSGLQRCSLAARGLWFELCLRMWDCAERGVLITGSRPWSHAEVAALISGPEKQTLACLDELLREGVASCDKRGAIFSRRMVRDEQVRQVRKMAGSKGGFATAKRVARASAKRVANSETETETEKKNLKKRGERGEKIAKSARKARAADPVWDALADVFYPSGIAPGQRRHVGALVRDFKAKGATPDELVKRVERYKRAWPDHACTPNAMLEHWDEFAEEKQKRGGKQNRPGRIEAPAGKYDHLRSHGR